MSHYYSFAARLLAVAVIALTPPAFVASAFAQGAKIAYVDAQILIEQAPQSQKVERELEEEFSDRQRALRDRLEKLRADQEDFEKNALLLSEAERTEKAIALQKDQREMQRAERDFREDLDTQRRLRISELESIISEVVLEISKQGGYDLVVQQAVYASSEIDITGQVLEALKER